MQTVTAASITPAADPYLARYYAVTTNAAIEKYGRNWMRLSTRKAHEVRTEGLCGLCGELVPEGEGVIMHMTPRSKGGLNTPDNCLYGCRKCNRRMGDKTLAEYCASRPRKGAAELERALGYLALPLPREAGRALARETKARNAALRMGAPHATY